MATIKGNSSNNNLVGTSSNDIIYGYGGKDTLEGKGGIDTLIGGIGDDIYIVDSTTDIITEYAGEGVDEVRSSVSYTMVDNQLNNLTLTGNANLNGTGNSYNNVIKGNNGNNILNGGGGVDTLIGGKGDDIYIVDSTTDVITELPGEGVDEVRSSVSYTMVDNQLNNLTLTGTGDIDGTGNSYNNVITGNSGDNTLEDNNAEDGFSGPEDNDVLKGGAGNDILVSSGTGYDTHYGGSGNDYLLGHNVFGYAIMYGGSGNDTIESAYEGGGIGYGEDGDDVIGTVTDNNYGGNGNDTLYGGGYGEGGNDYITCDEFSGGYGYGGDGYDTLIGEDSTYLDGGNENDSLQTEVNGGEVTMNGGSGSDSLFCGYLQQTIVFNSPTEGLDFIANFVSGEDVIQVSASGFGGGLVAGQIDSDQFVYAAAADSNDRFIYSNGGLFFDVDGTGATAAIDLAILVGAPVITAGDIVVA